MQTHGESIATSDSARSCCVSEAPADLGSRARAQPVIFATAESIHLILSTRLNSLRRRDRVVHMHFACHQRWTAKAGVARVNRPADRP